MPPGSGLVTLADRQAADGVAGKIDVHKLARALAAQIGESGALHDGELPLFRRERRWRSARSLLQKIVARTERPGGGALQCGLRLVARSGCFDAFIEHHGDVRTERQLNLRGFFGRQQMFGAVEMRAEAHAFRTYFAQIGETEDLVAAGIGQNCAIPRHKFVQTAKLADQFVPRAQK